MHINGPIGMGLAATVVAGLVGALAGGAAAQPPRFPDDGSLGEKLHWCKTIGKEANDRGLGLDCQSVVKEAGRVKSEGKLTKLVPGKNLKEKAAYCKGKPDPGLAKPCGKILKKYKKKAKSKKHAKKTEE